jgi:uncharacterized membrane protein YdbT with pleckstrin-like domain
MSYVKEVLQPGETVLFASTIHWLTYVPGAALVLVGLVAVLETYNGSAGPAVRDIVWGIALVCVAAGLLAVFRAWFRRWTTEIAVTDRRIIYKRGFIRRYTIEMHMDKVESVDVDQSVFGRIFDYGDVVVRGTGTGFEPLHMIEAPIKLRNAVTAK